jgi:nitrite reductase/ring-hydroxylating ferredoxin subunit
MLGYLVASSASYLGGHLVFAEQIGVDHTSGPESGKPDDYVAVLTDADLPEKTLTRVMAGNVSVLLVRIDGTIHAIRETCSHLGGPLSEGKLQDGTVTCPWHGSQFRLDDGSVVNGPSCYQQPRFDVRVRKGNIEVKAAEA